MLTQKDAIANKILLLYLITETNKKYWLGKTKLQKLLFLSEYEMIKNKVKGLNYTFYRWEHGAFSLEIYDDLRILAENNFVGVYEYHAGGFWVTKKEKSIELLNVCSELLQENKTVIRYIDSIIEKYGNLITDALKNIAYSVKIPHLNLTVKEIPLGITFLTPLSDKETKIKFKISDEWVETLEIYFDTEFLNSLRKGIENVKLGKICRVESELLNV